MGGFMDFKEKVRLLQRATPGFVRGLRERAAGLLDITTEPETGRVIVRRNIRQELLLAMKANHITMQEVAQVLGIKYQNLSKWVNGHGAFPSRRVEEILFLLDGKMLKEDEDDEGNE